MEEDIEEAIEYFKNWVNTHKYKTRIERAGKTLLNELEKQEDRITELEKALIDLDFKYRNKVEKKDNIIDLMGETILENTSKLGTFGCNGCVEECEYDKVENCIKQYFENQVNKINK